MRQIHMPVKENDTGWFPIGMMCAHGSGVSPKQDGLSFPAQPRGSLGGQAADRGVVLQLQGQVGFVDDPVGAEDHNLTRLAGKVHLQVSSQLGRCAAACIRSCITA